MRWLWLTGYLFAFSNVTAGETEKNHRKIEYTEISTLLYFAKNETRSPFIKILTKAEIKDKTIILSDLKLWTSRDNKIIEQVPIGTDGSLNLPLYSESLTPKTWLNINQPKGAVSLSISFDFNLGNKTEHTYYDLFILLEDINDFTGEMAGMASWFIPNMDALKFIFEKPATINIVSKKKTYHFKTNKEHEISIDVRRKLMKENPKVVFSIPPIKMEPED